MTWLGKLGNVPSCLKDKYPYADIDNEELLIYSFNSNLKWLCPTDKNKTYNLNTILTSHNNDKDTPHNEDLYENYIDLKPNFKYYETHDFHKLINSDTNNNNYISLFHTNICSLQANLDKLEILLDDLQSCS